MLPFENELLLDSHNEDALFIYSKYSVTNM